MEMMWCSFGPAFALARAEIANGNEVLLIPRAHRDPKMNDPSQWPKSLVFLTANFKIRGLQSILP
jgi:hypothetical protein